ncbi:MAG: hypothetical protein H6Q75_990 [Firmicutes bacterium]|nr:hypothetical protein [Bacillota bacterium]
MVSYACVIELHMEWEQVHLLNREAGEEPARSRHCYVESAANTTGETGKVRIGDETKPGDLPVSTHTVTTYGR